MPCDCGYMKETGTEKGSRAQQQIPTVMNFDLSPVRNFLIVRGSSPAEADAAIGQYRIWLLGVLASSEHGKVTKKGHSPDPQVDLALHAHIICSRTWRKFWRAVGGSFEHTPETFHDLAEDFSKLENALLAANPTFRNDRKRVEIAVDAFVVKKVTGANPSPALQSDVRLVEALYNTNKKGFGSGIFEHTAMNCFRGVRRFASSSEGPFEGDAAAAYAASQEYLTFMKSRKGGRRPTSIRDDIAKFWEAHLLCTDAYKAFCEEVLNVNFAYYLGAD